MIPKKLLDEINRWISGKLYGNIQINFAGGKILNIRRSESLRVEVLGTSFTEGVTVTHSSDSLDS